jgi:hypothetical protein
MIHEKALASLLKLTNAVSTVPPAPFAGFAGKWQNEYQSVAEFKVNGSAVSGTYTSKVSGTGQTVSGPIVGQASGDVIAFTVLWPTKGPSITSWVGQVIQDGTSETLQALWHLAMDISEDPKQVWESVFAGADVFTRMTK